MNKLRDSSRKHLPNSKKGHAQKSSPGNYSGAILVYFKQISNFVLVFPMFTMFTGVSWELQILVMY